MVSAPAKMKTDHAQIYLFKAGREGLRDMRIKEARPELKSDVENIEAMRKST